MFRIVKNTVDFTWNITSIKYKDIFLFNLLIAFLGCFSGIPTPTPAQQAAAQHKRIGVGMLPPHMQLPQFQSAPQQSVMSHFFLMKSIDF